MKNCLFRFIACLLLFLSFQFHHYSNAQSWIKAGYWYFGSELPAKDINSNLFTHLLCAFVGLDNSTYQLSIPSSDLPLFSNFTNSVQSKNPSIITLLSIWAGQGPTGLSISGQIPNSTVLSSMVTQASYRASFIESTIKTARLYGFHGLDLFWVWPGSGSDLTNLGTLLDEWRVAINSESRNSNESRLILTMGVHYVPSLHSVSYPVDSIGRNLDWAHVIAYDYYVSSRVNFTHAHAVLYDPTSQVNTNYGIGEWTSRGLAASKLVLGLPYHGYAWKLVSPKDNALGAPATGPDVTLDGSMAYKYIKFFIRNYGYGATSLYNSTYVFNYANLGSSWIGFDDVEAISTKVSYAKEKKLLGYNVFQVSNDDNWMLSQAAAQREGKGQGKNRKMQQLLVSILVPFAVIMLLLGLTICYLQRRMLKSRGMMDTDERSLRDVEAETSAAENVNQNATNLKAFSFADIQAATNNFSSENMLAEGGFGPVYKGKLPEGEDIAVKRLSKTSHQGLQEFTMEVTLTAKLQHVNLLRVLGFCTEMEEKMLIYEYMPNKSLDFYLFEGPGMDHTELYIPALVGSTFPWLAQTYPERQHLLDWRKRICIIEGITQGLLYIQEYSNLTIVHRDLKASNILLDIEMNPKISDFGMAKIFRKDEHEANTSRIVGTYGYVPPEYVRKGIYSRKYDVYSFGVLLLQIISGKKNSCFYGLKENLSLLEYAYGLWKDGRGMEFVDPSLDDSSSSCKLMRCLQMALLCVEENPVDRPSMLQVFSKLKNETSDIATPKKPAFSIQRDEEEENTSLWEEEIFAADDASISQMVF